MNIAEIFKKIKDLIKIGIYCEYVTPVFNFTNCVNYEQFLYSYRIGVLEYYLDGSEMQNPYSYIKPYISTPDYNTIEEALIAGINDIETRYNEYISKSK